MPTILVRAIGLELPIDPVQRRWYPFVRDCGAYHFAPAHALQCQAFHESLNGAAGNLNALSIHLIPDLVCPLKLHVGLPDLLDLWH